MAGRHQHLAQRSRQYQDRIVGDEDAGIPLRPTRLIDSVGREAQRVVDSYDRRGGAQLADGARNAVAASAAVGAGALGLGTIVTIAATTAAADFTGIVLGLGRRGDRILHPAGEAPEGKEEMRRKIADVRQTPLSGDARAIRGDRKRSGRIRESIGPYSRFIRAEGHKLRRPNRSRARSPRRLLPSARGLNGARRESVSFPET